MPVQLRTHGHTASFSRLESPRADEGIQFDDGQDAETESKHAEPLLSGQGLSREETLNRLPGR
jgi:hypothetical protein